MFSPESPAANGAGDSGESVDCQLISDYGSTNFTFSGLRGFAAGASSA